MKRILLVLLVLFLAILACNGGDSNGAGNGDDRSVAPIETQEENPTIQSEGEIEKPTDVVVPTIEQTLVPSVTPELPTSESEVIESPTACLPLNNEQQTARMVSVTDGDTIVVDINGVEYPVRYIGIDTPESEDIYGEISRSKNIELVKDQELTLVMDVSDTDEYERLLRYVLAGDTFVNYELVRQGYAMAGTWEPDVACDEVFREAENQAREEKLVIWVDKEPTDIPARGAGGEVANSGNVVVVNIHYDGVASDHEPDEYVEIRNNDLRDIQLYDWSLYDKANHRFKFPEYVLAPGETCRIYTNEIHPESCGFSFYFDKSAIWNNGGDCATLVNVNGDLVAQKCY